MKKFLSMILAITMFSMLALTTIACSKQPIYLGVQSGTTGQYFVDGDADWGFDGIDGYAAKGYQNGGLAVADMKSGNVKYVVIDEQPAKQLAQKVDGVKVIDVPLTVEEYAFGVDKNQPELLASINTILAEMKTSGKLDEIVAAYATEGKLLFLLAVIKEVTACGTADCCESKECTGNALLLAEKNKEHKYRANRLNDERNANVKLRFLKHGENPLS